jgi:hypothetical protein
MATFKSRILPPVLGAESDNAVARRERARERRIHKVRLGRCT